VGTVAAIRPFSWPRLIHMAEFPPTLEEWRAALAGHDSDGEPNAWPLVLRNVVLASQDCHQRWSSATAPNEDGEIPIDIDGVAPQARGHLGWRCSSYMPPLAPAASCVPPTVLTVAIDKRARLIARYKRPTSSTLGAS